MPPIVWRDKLVDKDLSKSIDIGTLNCCVWDLQPIRGLQVTSLHKENKWINRAHFNVAYQINPQIWGTGRKPKGIFLSKERNSFQIIKNRRYLACLLRYLQYLPNKIALRLQPTWNKKASYLSATDNWTTNLSISLNNEHHPLPFER